MMVKYLFPKGWICQNLVHRQKNWIIFWYSNHVRNNNSFKQNRQSHLV